ncbi:MAG: cysteine synthase A [Deltaproteobacteria bacterium]|nr:cysteine synthase A [Deltaproteobacteria bacterium]
MAIATSILDLIGQTPIVTLGRVSPAGGATVFGKCEQLNPGGSVKDRICLAMVRDAEERGVLEPGASVVEPTSGNTGIGLALACAVKGYRLSLTMPESMSLERRSLLEAYGATLVLTPAEQSMAGAVERAEEIAAETGAFMPQQFQNPANAAIHRRTTGLEIADAFAEEGLDAFVAGVGTGGTITGVSAVLRERFPQIRICAVEPDNSAVLSGEEPGPTKIQGLGAGFVPEVLDTRAYDEIRRVGDRDAWQMKVRLAREEGLFVGISAGAAVHASVEIARELGPGRRVCTVLADTGERYFSLDGYFS